MGYSEQLTQKLAYMDVVNSQAVTNASINSAQGIDMSKFKRVIYFVTLSSAGAAGTLDGRLQSSASATFASGVHNLTGTNLTQLVANNVCESVEIRADQVANQNAGDRYVRLNLTGGGNAVTVSAIGFGGDAIQEPGSQYNLNTTFLTAGVVCNT